jgi:hypothetical protein
MKVASYHNEMMEAYCNKICKLEEKFHGLELCHVLRLRRDNQAIDTMAKLTASHEDTPPSVFINDLLIPSAKLGGSGAMQFVDPSDTQLHRESVNTLNVVSLVILLHDND